MVVTNYASKCGYSGVQAILCVSEHTFNDWLAEYPLVPPSPETLFQVWMSETGAYLDVVQKIVHWYGSEAVLTSEIAFRTAQA